jgi:metallo-beta-lactamase class B
VRLTAHIYFSWVAIPLYFLTGFSHVTFGTLIDDVNAMIKLNLILVFSYLATSIASAETSLAEKNAAEKAAIKKEWESWNAPFKPFRLIGNIHYVGASGISSFLITMPEGHILIDTGFETTVPRIRDSVTKLGFKLTDIKIILNSHAHLDHTGGHALMQELTGARILMSEADAALLASGGTNDFTLLQFEVQGWQECCLT